MRIPALAATHVALFLLSLCAGLPASAHDYKAGPLVLHHPWTRVTPAGAKAAGGYVSISNTGSSADRLVGATFERAARVEIHEMAVTDGVMTMRPVDGGLEIAPGASLVLEPGKLHLMMTGLERPLAKGERIAGTLVFEKAGTVAVEFSVEPLAAAPAHHDHQPSQ